MAGSPGILKEMLGKCILCLNKWGSAGPCCAVDDVGLCLVEGERANVFDIPTVHRTHTMIFVINNESFPTLEGFSLPLPPPKFLYFPFQHRTPQVKYYLEIALNSSKSGSSVSPHNETAMSSNSFFPTFCPIFTAAVVSGLKHWASPD